jgi:hypothetical protein
VVNNGSARSSKRTVQRTELTSHTGATEKLPDSTREGKFLESLRKLHDGIISDCVEKDIEPLPLCQRMDLDAKVQAWAQQILNVELGKQGLPTWDQGYPKDYQMKEMGACGDVGAKAHNKPD